MGQIEFTADEDKESWIMRLNDDGIFFNTERYPASNSEDFANAVIKILEQKFKVHFEAKSPPYQREQFDDFNEDRPLNLISGSGAIDIQG